MTKKKIDILILTILLFLVGGMILAASSPFRDMLIPTFSRHFYIHIYTYFLWLGVGNIIIGLMLWKVRDATLKKIGSLTWILEIIVAGFVFTSVFFLRFDWGILPFFAGLKPAFFPLRMLPTAAIFATGLFLLNRWKDKRFGIGELLVLVGLSFLLNLAVLAINPSFMTGVTRTFNRKSKEYYGDISKVDHEYFFHYVEKMPELSLHGKTHPPLATLFLWILSRMGLGIFASSVVTVLFGSLTLVFVYLISRDLFGEEAARWGAGIFWLVPSVVLYSAVSMDVLFMFLCAATVFFFQRSLYNIRYVPLGAVCFSLALFSTFTAGFLLLIFAIWLGLSYFQENLPSDASRNLALGGVLILIVHLALYWGLNYNVVEVFSRARELNTAMMSGPQARPYSYWIVGNLVDYFTFLGLPVFSVICLYGWNIKKKLPNSIPFLWRLYLPSSFLISPA
jgi:hypothetical protein